VTGSSDSIGHAFRAGQAAWPGVGLDLDRFAERVAACSGAGLAAHGADLYLCAACAQHDPVALRYFDAQLARALPAARRYCPDRTAEQELLQRTRIHLLVVADGAAAPRVALYDGRASLATWIGVCLTRMALYMARSARNSPEIATPEWSDVVASLPTGQPELEAVRAHYAELFQRAWRTAAAELTSRPRTLLAMCFVEGCSIETIATTYAVHRVTIWRWLEQAKQALLDRTRELLAEALPADAPGTKSLLDLVRSQIDLVLSQLDAPM
jgi:RNA polymerase sigma-70 factor (ECF subfamily)